MSAEYRVNVLEEMRLAVDDAPGAVLDADSFPLLDIVALLDPSRPSRRWMWEDMVPEGDHVSIVAAGGTGKSLLVLALSVAMLRGEATFVDRPLIAPRRILYVDMENSDDDWGERLTDLGVTQAEASEWVGRFFPLSFPPLAGLDTAKGARQLLAQIDAHGIGAGDLVVLDSTQRLTDGEENSNDTIRRLYNLTSSALKRRGITVIRTDNTGHEGERARGASAKRDDVAMAWTLASVGTSGDVFTLTSKKRRARGSSDAMAFQRTTEGGRLTFRSTDATQTRAGGADFRPTTLMERASQHLEAHSGDSQTAIEKVVRGNARGLRRALDVLVAEGFVSRDRAGQTTKHYSLKPYRRADDRKDETYGRGESDA